MGTWSDARTTSTPGARKHWDDQPAYLRIAADLAACIESGELSNGQQLPTEAQLRATYGVSRAPVREAFMLLQRRGYVSSRRGRGMGGRFVDRPAKLELPLYTFERDGGAVDAFIRAVEDQGHQAGQTIRVERLNADAQLAAALQLELGDPVTVRRRLRTVDGRPYATADSYFPTNLVAGSSIEVPNDIRTGGRHVLADLGHPMTSHVDVISGRPPSPTEGIALEIPPDLWCFVHQRTSSTPIGVPIRHMIQVLPQDRWSVRFDLRDQQDLR